MLSALTKQSLVAQRYSLVRACQMMPVRSFASDTLKDKEKGDERIYFTKNDGKFLKK